MDNHTFLAKLKQGICAVFNEIESKEDIFEFGIFTDQDVSTIMIGYNTYTHFAAQLEEYFLVHNKIVSYYRWTMPEWYKEIGDENPFVDEINEILYNIIQPREAKENPNTFKNNLLDLLCKALLELRAEGLFRQMKSESIIYLQKADSFVDSLMKERVKKLIGEKYYEDFLYELKHNW